MLPAAGLIAPDEPPQNALVANAVVLPPDRLMGIRAGALGLFTCFLAGFIVLTIIGTHFRGPNWGFYWSPSDWPVH